MNSATETKKGFIVTPQDYLQLFQVNPQGLKVLADLAAKFFDGQIAVPNDQVMTCVRVGERNVVQYIINKCAQAQD